MKDDLTTLFFSFLEDNRIGIKDAAASLSKETQTVYNWRTKGVPKSQRLAVEAFISQRKPAEELTNAIVMEPTREQFRRWNKAALDNGQLIEDWALSHLNRLADEMESKEQGAQNTLPMSSESTGADQPPRLQRRIMNIEIDRGDKLKSAES